jgi:hypothetical protein
MNALLFRFSILARMSQVDRDIGGADNLPRYSTNYTCRLSAQHYIQVLKTLLSFRW